jgi:Uma2 family endonuclease
MTAEPLQTETSSWPMPPQDGYTVDDLFSLPDLPPHTEMIDGSLVFVSPQRDFHSLVVDLLVGGLRHYVPDDLRVRREMAIILSRKSAPEPDLSVVQASAVTSRRQTRFEAKDVVLAVEVVSPESAERDRDTKPHKYAGAGIPHFWRVEMKGDDDHPVVYVYELDTVTRSYVATGVHHERLKLSVPFTIDIDLTEIDRL